MKINKVGQVYYMDYICRNCGNHYREGFMYGNRAVQTVCPVCGIDEQAREMPDWTKKYQIDDNETHGGRGL